MKKLATQPFVFVLFLSASTSLQPQTGATPNFVERNLSFKKLSLEHGLSQSSILCILQDRKGFLWFGTQEGLNKYDGYRFTVYKHEASDSTSLSENYVEALYEDRSGTLWVGTIGGGLNRFNRDTETFTAFVHDPKNPRSISHDAILSIYEDSSGRLWIGTQGGGLNEMDRSTGRFTRYLHDPNNPHSLSNNYVWQIREDAASPNTLWLGTENGLNRFNRDTAVGAATKGAAGEFTRFVRDGNNPRSLSHNLIRAMCVDRAGTLWVGTWGGLNRFERDTQQFTRFVHDPNDSHSLGDNRIWAICEDPAVSGVLWIATYGGGLNRFDSRSTPAAQFTRFLHNSEKPSSLSDNNVKSIYVDRIGALWVGTWNGGVNIVSHVRKQFNHISRFDGLSHNTAQGFAVDPIAPHLVWIGTWGGGLNRFNRKTGQFTHFVHDPQNPRSLSHNRVRSVLFDHAGALWVGTDYGLNRFDRNTEEFVRFNFAPRTHQSRDYNTINAMYEDPVAPGTLWLGTNGDGLIRYVISGGEGVNLEQERVTHFDCNPEDPNALGDGKVSSLGVDHSGALWVGTLRGIHRFDRATGRFVRFVHDPANPHSLSHNTVLSIHESTASQGTPVLWIGTGGGLNKFAYDTEQFTHYTEKDGLPSAVIHGILEDGHGRLWLSTNNGLSRLDPSASPPVFRNYDVTDGLQSNEFGEGAGHKSAAGEMFFGGINGLNFFHPDSIKDNPHVPPVVITDFQIFNHSAKIGGKDSPLRKHISETEEIVLSHRQSVFSFEFAALDYTAPEKNRYAYKMEGFDRDWNQVGARRFATYTNLDPGDYVFRVRGANNDGVWNETGAAIKITITPPPWKTWWAYLLYVLLGTAFLYGLRRYELNRIRLKNQVKMKQLEAEKLKELDTLKSRFFANLSHEFRTPLTLILGPVEQILGEAFDEKVRMKLRLVHANGQRLLALINQLLDLSKLESGKMELRAAPGNPVEFLQRLTVSFAALAERKRIALRFEAKEQDLEMYFDRDKMEKIFSNLLSNAIKFTPEGGEVSVQLSVISNQSKTDRLITDHWLLFTVKDTGIGIPTEKLPHIFDRFYQADTSSTREFEGTGIGLALVKELVELHHGKISVASAEGKGATFTVRLPLGKDHLAPEEILEVSEQYSSVISEQPSVVSDQYSVISEDASEKLQVASEERGAMGEGRGVNGEERETASDEQTNLILIVEDHAEMRRYLREELEPAYRVLEAGDGEAGWQMAVEAIPDLVICDVMMPRMNGYEFCSRLKTDERTSHVPVILLTAKAGIDDKVEGLETGADDYLSKPFAAKELRARVKNLIALRRKLRQRFAGAVALKPSEIAVTSIDEKFLRRLLEIVEAHLDDEDFGVETMSHEAGMSQPQLWRKIKALTGQSPNQFIRAIRLQRAKQLLEAKTGNIAEVAYAVGFSNLSYFAKCFREQFGQPPSVYKDSDQRSGKA